MKLHLTKICIPLVTLAIASNLRKISALSCHKCIPRGFSDECADPYQLYAGRLIKCPLDDTYVCGKFHMYGKGARTATIRRCIRNSSRDIMCDVDNYENSAFDMECFYCDKDACNASHRVTISPTTQYLIAASIFISLASFGILKL